MSLEQKYGLGRFDGKDYEYWCFRLMTLIRAEGLEYILKNDGTESDDSSTDEDFDDTKDGTADGKDVKDVNAKGGKDGKSKQGTSKKMKQWKQDDRKCLAIIVRHLADSHIVYARDANSSIELLDKLDEMYKKRGTASRIYLKRQWQNLKLKPGDNLNGHFRKFDELVTGIRACGCKLDDRDIIDQLLMSMPDSYSVTVEVIESLKSPTMEVVRMKLLNRFNKLEHSEEESMKIERTQAMVCLADGRDKKDANTRIDNKDVIDRTRNKDFTCYNCGGRGHIAKYCKKPRRSYSDNNTKPESSSKDQNDVCNFVNAIEF